MERSFVLIRSKAKVSKIFGAGRRGMAEAIPARHEQPCPHLEVFSRQLIAGVLKKDCDSDRHRCATKLYGGKNAIRRRAT